MIERPSARLILLDSQDRLFLFNVHDPAVFDPAQLDVWLDEVPIVRRGVEIVRRAERLQIAR